MCKQTVAAEKIPFVGNFLFQVKLSIIFQYFAPHRGAVRSVKPLGGPFLHTSFGVGCY